MKKYNFLLICIFYALLANAQSWRWAKQSTFPFSPAIYMEALQTVTDRDGNVIMTAIDKASIAHFGSITVTNPSPSLGENIIIKLDSTGSFKWIVAATAVSGWGSGVAASSSGSVYFLGCYQGNTCTIGSITLTNMGGTTLGFMYYLAKCDKNGNVIWAQNIGQQVLNYATFYGQFSYGSVVVDQHDSIIVTGAFTQYRDTISGIVLTNADASGNTSDIFLAKFDSSGNIGWAKGIGGTKSEFPISMNAAPSGNFYLAGEYKSHSLPFGSHTLTNVDTIPNLFIACFDGSGNGKWADSATGNVNPDYLGQICSDQNGNVYVPGSFYQPTINFGSHTLTRSGTKSAFLVKYDAGGHVKWAKSGNSSGSNLNGFCVATDYCNNVWFTGQMAYSTPMTFDTGTLYPPGGTIEPAFIIQCDTNGNYVKGMVIKNGGDDILSIAVNNLGDFYIGGDIYAYPRRDTFVLGADTMIVDSLTESLFIAKYHYSDTACPAPNHSNGTETVNEIQPSAGISIFPNPATGQFSINTNIILQKGTRALLLDPMGKMVGSYALNERSTDITTSTLSPGIYLCVIYCPEMQPVYKKVTILK